MFAKCLKNSAECDDHARARVLRPRRTGRPTDRRTGVIFSGRPPCIPPSLLLPMFACVSIELAISRPCRGHSRPDLNKRDRNLIGPIRRRNEFPLERGEALARTHLASRYHSLENAPPLLLWIRGSDNRITLSWDCVRKQEGHPILSIL